MKTRKRNEEKKAARANLNLTNEEVASALGVSENTASNYRKGMRHAIKNPDSVVYIGTEKENEYGKKLQEMGMCVELMPHRHKFDALVNGWRVDFKYGKTPLASPSMKNVNPTWQFQVRKGKKYRERCDFFFCITGNDDVFIIPSSEIPASMSSLVFCYPVAKNSKGKWQAYRNRYDLLETPKQEIKTHEKI